MVGFFPVDRSGRYYSGRPVPVGIGRVGHPYYTYGQMGLVADVYSPMSIIMEEGVELKYYEENNSNHFVKWGFMIIEDDIA